MNKHDIIKRPVITERSTEAMSEKKYTFEVDPRANKTQIKQHDELQREIQTIWPPFGVHPSS